LAEGLCAQIDDTKVGTVGIEARLIRPGEVELREVHSGHLVERVDAAAAVDITPLL